MKPGHRLIKDHGTHFEVAPPKGDAFMVAKRGLDPKTVKAIAALPQVQHRYDGENDETSDYTDADDSANDTNAQDVASAQERGASGGTAARNWLLTGRTEGGPPPGQTPDDDAPGAIGADQVEGAPATPDQVPMASAANPTGGPNTANPVAPQQNDGNGAPGYGDIAGAYGNAYGLAEQGLKDAQTARDQGNSQTQAVIAGMNANMAASQARADANFADWKARDDKLMGAYQNGTIDPNRVWNNASTGNKVIAGIGVLLSGIGSGLSGQPNMAMKVINDTIDRDIEGQKANMGKTATLLEANYRRFGNMQAAEAATRATLLGTAQAQIQAIGSNTQNGIAAGAMKQALSQIEMQKASMMLNANISNRQNAVMNSGGGGNVLSSPAEAERLFPGKWVNVPGAGIRVAPTPEDAKIVKETQSGAQNLGATLSEMQNFMNKTGTAISQTSRATADALRNRAIAQVNELAGLKRLSSEDVEIILNQIPNPGAFFQSSAQAQLNEAKKTISNKLNSVYANHLTNWNPSGITETPTK